MTKDIFIIVGVVIAVLLLGAYIMMSNKTGPLGRGDLIGFPGKHRIKSGGYFLCGFDQDPKMGTAVLKVQVFDQKNFRISSYDVFGDLSMPSMAGAHDSGHKKFVLSNRGDYLCPFDIAMPGGWEIKLQFYRSGRLIHEESLNFSI